MGDHNTSPTCVSAEPHGPTSNSPGAISDLIAHYFGCIKISERIDFLDKDKNCQLWDHELHVQLDKLQQQNRNMPKHEREELARNKVDEKIKGLAFNIESQYKRTDILRKALSGVKCLCCRTQDKHGQAHENTSSSEDPSCDLVSLAHRSHKEWKSSDRYKMGINIIRSWRRSKDDVPPIIGHDNIRNASDGEGMVADREEVRNIIKKDHKDVDYAFKEDENTPYELERDTNGYIIQWEVLRPWEPQHQEQTLASRRLSSSLVPQMPAAPSLFKGPFASSPTASSSNDYFEEQGSSPKRRPTCKTRAFSTVQPPSFYETGSGPEKYLKPVNESATDYRFKGRFPDQRTTLQNLLSDKPGKKSDVILYRKRLPEEPRVRYVHIPHNNMKWVEEAIARYFHEESPTHRSPQVKTHSQIVLRPEYWRGQQHGGRRTTVHARHMRAICERISSNIWELEDNPDNIVLFMPFLHWEEDRKRDKMAKTIEQETARNRAEREEAQNEAKRQRVSERTYRSTAGGRNLLQAEPQLRFQHPRKVDEAHHRIINSTWQKNSFGRPDGKHARNFVEVADGFIPGGTVEDEHVRDGRKVWHVAKLTCDEHGRVRTQNKLGQFLLDAARLYEAISMYRDQQLVEKYLHHDPPLHPRRTLDQSYYWTLKSTKSRDRDQVVYRGTTMDDRDIHKLRKRQDDCKDQRKIWHPSKLLDRKKCASVEAPEEREAASRMGIYKWDGHWEKAEEEDIVCDHCRGEIRKVSRIVMVDQLWMWILDRQTIITSFPKRYGTNKSDPSGVHKSIRTRIKNARKNQIRSVFDVALIILDECSNTFFDRTKTTDRHPQVIDIFAESIGSLQNKQTVSFQHLWHWTERASKIYNSKSKYEDTAHLHAPLLNINPEGKLQREIRDIIDELDIMIHVNKKQNEVIKRFVKNVENIYDPCGTWRDETLSPDGDRDYLRSRSKSRADDDAQGMGRNRMPKGENDESKLEREKDEFTWFRKQAYDLISDVGDRIAELEGLRKSAESASQGIKDLLDLKQQQASILQAWQSVRQADESVRQGRSVMIFTIVTIIFLPLSFMSSVFGMNNRDIGDTNMSFSDQAAYMFPISASVILVSIIFAFWTYPRTVVWSAYKYSETWILVKFGIYDVFLWLKEWKTLLMTSDDMLKSLEKSVEKMKNEVKSRRTKSAAGRSKGFQANGLSDHPGADDAHENYLKSKKPEGPEMKLR